jgi:iron complex transport system ATP-binding protein
MIRIIEGKIGYGEVLLSVDHLEIGAGTLTALIGENGSGKSTFLKSICGMMPTLGGSFLINNEPLSELKPDRLSKLVSFVGSTQQAIPYMTVIEYVLLGRSPYTGVLGRYQSRDYSVSNQVIDLFHLSHLKDRELSQLSDGERQLASFARAFSQETPIILMDEPTAFLDYGNKRTLIKLLRDAAKKESKSVIVSTHDIDLCIEEGLAIIGIQSKYRLISVFGVHVQRDDLLKQIFPH